MADKDTVLKALQICEDAETTEDCIDCPYYNREGDSHSCIRNLFLDNTALINSQQAEIERLKNVNQNLTCEVDRLVYDMEWVKQARDNAVTVCLEKLKEFMHNKFKKLDEYEFEYVTERDMDDFEKEMAGAYDGEK